MSTSPKQWLVEEFRLSSPVKEFEDFCHSEIDRLRTADPEFDDKLHRRAIDLILGKLRRDGSGEAR